MYKSLRKKHGAYNDKQCGQHFRTTCRAKNVPSQVEIIVRTNTSSRVTADFHLAESIRRFYCLQRENLFKVEVISSVVSEVKMSSYFYDC